MIEKFKEVLYTLLQKEQRIKGVGNQVVLKREQFNELPPKMLKSHKDPIPLNVYMDTEMQKAVAEELEYLYNMPKSDGDHLVFLDMSPKITEDTEGWINIITYGLDETGEVIPFCKSKLKI